MARMSFRELVGLLPVGGLPKGISTNADSEKKLRVPISDNKPFIEPAFDRDEIVGFHNPHAILISAPAAVGKSTLAETLAARTSSLLWDLGGFSVGDYFFTGQLADSFGPDQLNPMIDAIRAGQTTLILDSADEALVRVGTISFEAAMTNLASIIQRPSSYSDREHISPQLVVLGRPDTIEDVRAILHKNSITSETIHVSFFDQTSAEEFVHLKARPGSGGGVAGRELTTFLRNFFEITMNALGVSEWSDCDSFLGYAPVLDALAKFYTIQPNPIKTLSEIQKSQNDSHVWELLCGIVRTILERETEKFASSFGESDERRIRFAEDVYPPEAQIRLLLSDDSPENAIEPPAEDYYKPEWFLDELPLKLRNQFREHPFSSASDSSRANPLLCFSSVVFRDYAIASLIGGRSCDDLDRVLEYWLDPRVSPSPFLLQFCMHMHGDEAQIPVEALAPLVDSHAVTFNSGDRLEIAVFSDESLGDSKTKVVELTLQGDSGHPNTLLSTLQFGAHIELSRSISRATVVAPGTNVMFGPGLQDFTIGPDVTIICGYLEAESVELRVKGGSANPSRIAADGIRGTTRRISGTAGNGLRIEVPKVAYPWEQFASRANQDGSQWRYEYWIGLIVRRTVKWFVKGNNGKIGKRVGINYPIEGMDAILGKGRASRAFHDFCVERGYISQDSKLYYINIPGVNVQSIDRNDLDDDSYLRFIREFQDWVEESDKWTLL